MARIAETDNRTSQQNLPTYWQLMRHELLYILYALMEVALIAPLLLAFSPWARFWSPGIVTIWLLLLMLIPFNLSRLASVFHVPVSRQQLLLVFALLVTILITWRTILYQPHSLVDFGWLGEFWSHLNLGDNPLWSRDLALFVAVVVMWWRGISLVGRHVDIADIGLRLRFGILLVFLFVAGLAGSLLSWPVTPFVLLFFFAALMSIVLTRIEQLERGRSGQSFPIGFRWLFAVAIAAGLVVFLTGVVAGFISGESISRTIGWLSPLWLALYFLTSTSLVTVSVLLSPLLAALSWLFSLIIGIIEPTLRLGLENVQLTIQSESATQEAEQITEAADQAFQLPRQLLPILIMIFFVLLVTLALGRLFRSTRYTAVSQSESINPLQRASGLRRPALGRRLLNQLSKFRRMRAAASIRHIYSQMCRKAADLGYPRAQSETPYEYMATLDQLWPQNPDDVRRVTEAFVMIRYGEFPESKEDLEKIVEAWDNLEVASTAVEPIVDRNPE